MKTLSTQEEMWPESHHKDYFLELMRKAVDLAGTEKDDLNAIHQLSEGWVAEETLAIAFYCALKYLTKPSSQQSTIRATAIPPVRYAAISSARDSA